MNTELDIGSAVLRKPCGTPMRVTEVREFEIEVKWQADGLQRRAWVPRDGVELEQ